MSQAEEKKILDRLAAHFERVAPLIVRESVKSLKTDKPIIDYYDIDFYLSKLEGAFGDLNGELLREVISNNIDTINEIFLKNYRNARVE